MVIIYLAFFLLLTLLVSGLCIGRYPLPLKEIFKLLIGQGSKRAKLVILNLRLPKLLLACLVGIGMGSSGTIMQSLLHNDLASPGTLGVADGSSLFVTLYICYIASRSSEPILLPILAFGGGILSSLIIFLLVNKKRAYFSPIKLIMTGIATGSCYSAISTFLMFLLDESQLEFLQRWQAGELWASEWNYLVIFSIWLLIFFILAMLGAKTLNVIDLGYDIACSLGVNLRHAFVYLALIAIAISSASVAFGGNFFFLGLIGPHIAKKLIGVDKRYLIPLASLVSSIIIVLALICVENIIFLINIPTGIIINILSIPYFLYLLVEKNGK